MKEGWEVKKLGEVCEVLNGFAFKSDKYVEDGVRVIRITNVQHGYIEDNDPKFYPIDECERLNQYMLKEQDLLMSLTGNVGRVGLLDNKFLPAALNQRVACLRVKDKSVELKYLFHHLYSELFETRCIQSAKGIAQKNMSTEWLKEYSIPIPPFPEQSRIVEELDLLSNIIEKKRQQLSELDNLAQSIFYDMFGDPVTNEKGWEVKLIGEISTFYNGKAHEKNIVEDSGFLLVNAKFISSCGDIKKYSDMQLFPLYKNDITMVMSDLPNGKTLAKCYLIEKNDTYTLNQRICAFRGYKQNPIFLKYVLNRNKYYLSFDDGNGQTNLRKSDVVNCPIILPPLSLQQLFAQKIEAIEKQKELIKQSIAETEELFNSRMDYYFS